VAALEPHHVDPLVARLADDYYIPVDRLRAAASARSSCNIIHLATMFKIDVFVAPGRPVEAAARAQSYAIDETPGAPLFPVASAEDTVLAKPEGFRRGGEISGRQWWDIVGVLRVTPGLDRTYLDRWAASLGVADRLQRALDHAAEG